MKKNWQTVELQDIAVVKRGKFSVRPRNDPKYFGGEIPFLQTGDVAGASGATISTYSQTLNNEGLKVSKYFPAGTLLITIAANIGDVAEVGFGFACTDSLVAVQPKEGIDKSWLKFFLQTQKSYFESRATQNAQANINLQTIRPLLVELPPFSEQTAIASLLSTWDLTIEKTEQLVEAKERSYLWLSTKYLFGDAAGSANVSKKTKWFSVPDHWKIVKIGKIASEVSSFNNSRESIPVLSCTKYDGLVDSLTYFDKQVFSQDTSTYKVVAKGHFAYATNHIEEGSIGYSKPVKSLSCPSGRFSVIDRMTK
jgi:type I restriction enzyme, S subunit